MTINKNVKIGLRYNKDIPQLDIDDIVPLSILSKGYLRIYPLSFSFILDARSNIQYEFEMIDSQLRGEQQLVSITDISINYDLKENVTMIHCEECKYNEEYKYCTSCNHGELFERRKLSAPKKITHGISGKEYCAHCGYSCDYASRYKKFYCIRCGGLNLRSCTNDNSLFDDIKGKKTTINNVIAIESSFNLLTVGEYLDIKKEYEKRNIEFALDYYVKNAKIFFNVMNTDS